MKKFSSKIGLEIFLPLAILLSVALYNTISDANWPGLLITLAIIAFLIYLLFSTNYIISGDILEVKCGIFYDRIINVHKIKTIKEVSDFFAAPAASIKKLEIKYNNKESVAIAPKDKAGFLKILKQINPDIQIC